MHTKPVHIKSGSIPLSKEQQSFNRLVKRIEKLQQQILDETNKLEQLNRLYMKEIFPNVLELGKLKIRVCHLLHKKRSEIKLSAAQSQKLDDILLDFLDDAFSVIEPDDATKELYSQYSDTTYEEELSSQEAAMKEDFTDMLYGRFGIRLDPSLLTENMDREKIEAELNKQWEQKEKGKKEKRKSKKQQEKEQLEQQKEALKNKSLRSVYVALAKILHPDMEQDEALKIEKEEMMKKVTVAYENRDMIQLLQLEMQWIKNHDESLNSMEGAALNAYILLLKDQVKELEAELDMLYLNPAFSAVADFRFANVHVAATEIKRQGRHYYEVNKKLQTDLNQLEHGTKTKAAVLQCIRDYYSEPGNDFFDEDMLDFLSNEMMNRRSK
ncbi:hypothetical protein [Niastella populi]|uniref:Molecular chaperone DnaJ n=1 Tax=Niastella populi TaxID=550983 RepID=A0A1V9G684_9BACT|nr:hypothetical protein [Niastella populi]OQP66149.1 hypothetical protein A4R26_13735 [Niastella populi]